MDTSLPDRTAKTSRKILVPVIALTILSFGFLMGYAITTGSDAGSYEKGFADGLESARTILDETGMFEKYETDMLSGTIVAVNADSIEIAVPNLNSNPLSSPTPEKRTVMISADTKMNMAEPIDEDEYGEALEKYYEDFEAWAESMSGSETESEPPQEPTGYLLTEIKIDDLSAGMTVRVKAEGNITDAESFDAIEIEATEIETTGIEENIEETTTIPEEEI